MSPVVNRRKIRSPHRSKKRMYSSGQTEVDDVSIGLETAIPCGLIINELVSNSLKYAFPGNKKGESGLPSGRLMKTRLFLKWVITESACRKTSSTAKLNWTGRAGQHFGSGSRIINTQRGYKPCRKPIS